MNSLLPFDPDTQLRRGSVCLVIGHQNTGKSWLIRDLIERSDASGGLLIEGGCDDPSPIYKPILDRVGLALQEFRESAVSDVIRDQRHAGEDVSHAFVVLDDCIYNYSVFKTLPVRFLIMNGRTVHTSLFIAQTYAMGLPPTLRTSIDYIFVFRQSIRSNVKRIYNQYVDRDKYTLDELEMLLRMPRTEYDCIVIDNCNTSLIYRYRALARAPRPIVANTLPQFDPVASIRPGDRCDFSGAGRKTPLICDILAHLPDLSAGYLVMHEDALPPFRDYASLRGRVRTAARYYRNGYSLARHLLDISGAGPSFVILDDCYICNQNIPLEYLELNRRDLGIMIFQSFNFFRPLDRQDYLFLTYPPDHVYEIQTIYDTSRIRDRISFDDFCRLLRSLDYLQYECLVIEQRTGQFFLYKPVVSV